MDREVQWATAHGVAQIWTRLKQLSTAHSTEQTKQHKETWGVKGEGTFRSHRRGGSIRKAFQERQCFSHAAKVNHTQGGYNKKERQRDRMGLQVVVPCD